MSIQSIRWVLPGAGTLVLVLGAYWTLLFLVQRSVVFPAPIAADGGDRPADAEQLWFDLPSGRAEAWFLPARGVLEGPRPLLIFAHGNAELIDHWPAEFDEPRAWGLSVLLVEYPGYGRSPGRASQESVTQAVLSAHDWALKDRRVDFRRIVGYGRSLGGGAVCALARERPLAALVLESTFASARRMARRFGLPGFLVRDPFDNRAVVASFRGPLLIVHGEHDDIIPPSHARELHRSAPTSTLQWSRCGHNDCPRPWPALRRFLRESDLL